MNRTCIPLPAARMTGTILPVVRRGGVMTEFHPARAEPAQADRQQVCGWSDGLADEHRVRLPRNRSHCFAVVVGHSLWPPVQSGVAGTLIGLSALGVLGASIFQFGPSGRRDDAARGSSWHREFGELCEHNARHDRCFTSATSCEPSSRRISGPYASLMARFPFCFLQCISSSHPVSWLSLASDSHWLPCSLGS